MKIAGVIVALSALATVVTGCGDDDSELSLVATDTPAPDVQPTATDTPASALKPTPSPRPTGTPAPAVQPTPWSTLRPADAQLPAAGICLGPNETDTATITINPDVPNPRCYKVTASQRLQIASNLGEEARIQLGPFDLAIPPGEARLLDAPVGMYLAPGVHGISISIPPGRATVWLIE